MIDAGQVRLEGKDGLIQQPIKVGLELGLQAELTEHLGYEKGDPEAGPHPNSHNGTSAKTVATSVGDLELEIPTDRDGSFTPVLVPRGSRRVGGLDDVIVSLYGRQDGPRYRTSSGNRTVTGLFGRRGPRHAQPSSMMGFCEALSSSRCGRETPV